MCPHGYTGRPSIEDSVRPSYDECEERKDSVGDGKGKGVGSETGSGSGRWNSAIGEIDGNVCKSVGYIGIVGGVGDVDGGGGGGGGVRFGDDDNDDDEEEEEEEEREREEREEDKVLAATVRVLGQVESMVPVDSRIRLVIEKEEKDGKG